MSRVATSAQDFAVIQAWKNGQPLEGTGGKGVGSFWMKDKETDKWKTSKVLPDFRLKTNGRKLFSYGHCIGDTTADGKKVAFNCSKNQFTKKHCLDARTVADFVRVVCPSCHKGDDVARTNTPLAEDQTSFAQGGSRSVQVFKSWKAGEEAVFAGKNKDTPLKSDGSNLLSYGHKIGETLPDGTKVAYNCRRTNNGKKPSPFALEHTKLVKKFSDMQLSNCPTCDPDTAI